MAAAQLRWRDIEGNVFCEVKSSPVESTLDPRWGEEMVLDVHDVHDGSVIELVVYDSRTGRMTAVVGIPVHTIHRNPKRHWVKLQDPNNLEVSFRAGVVDAGALDIESCQFGAVELEHSLKWKSGHTVRQRILEVMRDNLE